MKKQGGGGANQSGHDLIGGLESNLGVRLFADDTVVYVSVHRSSLSFSVSHSSAFVLHLLTPPHFCLLRV